jgi:hypothetical protein
LRCQSPKWTSIQSTVASQDQKSVAAWAHHGVRTPVVGPLVRFERASRAPRRCILLHSRLCLSLALSKLRAEEPSCHCHPCFGELARVLHRTTAPQVRPTAPSGTPLPSRPIHALSRTTVGPHCHFHHHKVSLAFVRAMAHCGQGLWVILFER